MLANKKILLAVSGSIAAYKTAFFVRLLIKEGAEVKVIMTQSAKDFITPLTLATLSKNPVLTSYFNESDGTWHNHVELGLWADLMIIAPLSANTLGKMANGICDNLLLATYLSAKCPVLVAPAMDLDMFRHPTTQANLKRLESFGNQVIDAGTGELASGLEGKGRMAEPEEILEAIKSKLFGAISLSGKKALITLGPTYEAIDPVRFIGNHSSGKMGVAIAESLKKQGAEVTLISGPTNLDYSSYSSVTVNTAQEMLSEVETRYHECDIAVFSAAVADYRPKQVSKEKIKKSDKDLTIELTKNPDIAFEMGKLKKHQIHIGFALETNNEAEHAKQKLKKKNFDLIVLNSLNDTGAGFKGDTNKVTFFDRNNIHRAFELKSKKQVAEDIVNHLTEYLL